MEHTQTQHFKDCKKIFETQTGITVPLPNKVIKLPDGRKNDIYGEEEDACVFVKMFETIAKKVGRDLNNTNWSSTVNNFGPIVDLLDRLRVAAHRQVRRRRHVPPRGLRPLDRRCGRLEASHRDRERQRLLMRRSGREIHPSSDALVTGGAALLRSIARRSVPRYDATTCGSLADAVGVPSAMTAPASRQ